MIKRQSEYTRGLLKGLGPLNIQGLVHLGATLAVVWSMAQVYGASGVGTLAMFQIIVGLGPLLASLGAPIAITHLLRSSAISSHDAWRISSVTSLTVVPVTCILLGVAIGTASDAIFPSTDVPALFAALPAFAAATWFSLCMGMRLGRNDFVGYSTWMIVRSLGICCAAFAMPHAGANIGTTCWGIAGIHLVVALVASPWRDSRSASNMSTKTSLRTLLMKTITFGWKAQATTLANQVNYRADTYLVNLMISPVAAGFYLVCSQVADALTIAANSMATTTFTRVSAGDHGRRRTVHLTILGVATTFGLGVVAAPVVSALAPWFLGSEFTGMLPALAWLCIGVAWSAASRILANDIAGRGHPGHNLWSAGVAAALNIALNLLLIGHMGVVGAAIATASAMAIDTSLKLVIFLRLSASGRQS